MQNQWIYPYYHSICACDHSSIRINLCSPIKRAKDTYSKRLLLAGHIHAIHQTVRFSILNSSVPHLIYASVLVFEIIAKNENFLFNMGLNGENMKNGNLTLKN